MIKRKIAFFTTFALLLALLLTPMSASAASQVLPGDLDNSGDIDMMDALTLYTYVSGRIELSAEQLARADATGDGKVGLADAVRVFYQAVRIIPVTPPTTTPPTTMTTMSPTTTTLPPTTTTLPPTTTTLPPTTTTLSPTTTTLPPTTTTLPPTTTTLPPTTTTLPPTTTTTTTTKATTTTTTKTTTAPTSPTALYGIDVSEMQGTIDWQKVQKSGVDFAILRCGYGQDDTTQDDENWEENAAACEELGIPYGAYFFCYARNATEAIGEAKHALRLLEGKDMTLPIFLDMEYSSYQGDLTNAEYAAIAKMFCRTLSNAGYKVGVYANLDWWDNRLTDPCFDEWYRWVAQYNDECEYEGTVHLWQYSEGATIPGVTENTVDVNYAYVDFTALEAKRRESA